MDTKTDGTASTKPAESMPADDLDSGNIDKVRDILFGGQMRDYERRFARLEDRLLQETSDMKDEVRKRLSALEQFIRQELDSLADRVKNEQEERADADKDLARESRDAAKALEKKAGQLDDQIGRAQRDLRQQLLELHQRMTDELRQKTDDVLAHMTHEASELRADKTDRATLAALLTEMAMRLNNELQIPGVDHGKRG